MIKLVKVKDGSEDKPKRMGKVLFAREEDYAKIFCVTSSDKVVYVPESVWKAVGFDKIVTLRDKRNGYSYSYWGR